MQEASRKRRSCTDTFYFHLGAVIAPLLPPFIPPLQYVYPQTGNNHNIYRKKINLSADSSTEGLPKTEALAKADTWTGQSD